MNGRITSKRTTLSWRAITAKYDTCLMHARSRQELFSSDEQLFPRDEENRTLGGTVSSEGGLLDSFFDQVFQRPTEAVASILHELQTQHECDGF